MSNKTFIELYNEAKNQPTPAQKFISDVATITHRSEVTVRMWLAGAQVPDDLAKVTIADKFGVSAEGLFPKKKEE
jgi:hypothetical protein